MNRLMRCVLVALVPIAVVSCAEPYDHYRDEKEVFTRGPAMSLDAQERTVRDVTAVLKRQQAAWNAGNIDAFVSDYQQSPNLTFSTTHGTERGYDEVLARYRRRYTDRATMGELTFSGLEIRVLGDQAALVLGTWKLNRDKGDISGVFSVVFQEIDGHWKIVHDHTSQFEADSE
ncbi:MAG: nuclear transport factor 2 family protein [Planctomycetota bacterium]